MKFGDSINNYNIEVGKECFVLLDRAMNESWYIPIGYFIDDHINCESKTRIMLF